MHVIQGKEAIYMDLQYKCTMHALAHNISGGLLSVRDKDQVRNAACAL